MEEKKRYKVFSALSILGIIVFAVSFSVYFFKNTSFIIEEIEIKGNSRISNSEIVKRSGIRAGITAIFFHEENARKLLLKNSWINDVTIIKEYPNKVVLEINEAEPFCIVTTEEGKNYYINEDGKKLGEINSLEGMDYPVINPEGRYDSRMIGDAISILQYSKKSDVLGWEEISEIKISNKFGIRVITTDQRYIDFGTNNLLSKWYKVEKIINQSRNINLVEQYINISSENLGIVDFNI